MGIFDLFGGKPDDNGEEVCGSGRRKVNPLAGKSLNLPAKLFNIKMFGKRFEKELEMIDEAIKSEQGEKDFMLYVKPFLESVVDEYINEKNLNTKDRDLLIKAGWTHFGLALKKYKNRTKMMLQGKNDIFYFNSYFNWYIRQGIIEYIKSNKK